jgi:hypothetical protein
MAWRVLNQLGRCSTFLVWGSQTQNLQWAPVVIKLGPVPNDLNGVGLRFITTPVNALLLVSLNDAEGRFRVLYFGRKRQDGCGI